MRLPMLHTPPRSARENAWFERDALHHLHLSTAHAIGLAGAASPVMRLEGYTTGDFDRGAPCWKELLWMLAKVVFFENGLPWPSALRVALLRAFGARIGHGVVIRSKVNITFPWRLTIGDHVWLGEEVLILSLAPVTLESDVCISQRAFLCTGSHRFDSPGFDLVTKSITIHRGSWIAAQAFIAPGVSIGPESMVAAGAVVTHDVAPGTIVSGNPATVREKAVV